jgi:ribosomal protein S27AE
MSELKIIPSECVPKGWGMMVGEDGNMVFAHLEKGVIKCKCGNGNFISVAANGEARLYCKKCGKEIQDGS